MENGRLDLAQNRWELLEESANFLTHALGFVLSLVGFYFLVIAAQGDLIKLVSAAVFGSSLVLLYMASTLYHGAQDTNTKHRLKIFDHCAIYVLIAGSYTPITLVTLGGTSGWMLFWIVWSFAIVGVIYKLFFVNHFPVLSTFFYLMMGWLVVFFIEPLMNGLPEGGLYLLIGGGLAYTLGSVIYIIEKPLFHHAIWHLFVMTGSTCHYLTVLLYIF